MEYTSDIINLAVVNFKATAGDKSSNLRRIAEFSAAAARRGADMVVFPEMCLTGYDYFIDGAIGRTDKLKMAETVSGQSVTTLAAVAAEHSIYIVFGMPERPAEDADFLYNAAVVLGPDGLVGCYRKIHPFADENLWCAKGEEPLLFDTKWGPVGVGICYDSYQFPELVRHYAHRGARLYLNPTAVVEEIPGEGSREAFRRYYTTTLEYLARSCTIYVASANLTGYDGRSYFGGGSMVVGPRTTPFGESDVHTYCGGDNDNQVGIRLTTLDLSLATRRLFVPTPQTGIPDYRPDVYKRFL